MLTVIKDIKDNFLQELERARDGQPSSLLFIKHQLPDSSLVQEGETFQVIVIGGSVFRKALLKKAGDQFLITQYHELAQPPFLTGDDFLAFMAQQIDPKIQILGLNFAYPLSPLFIHGRLDGTLISGTKENTFTGLTDKPLGKTLEDFLQHTHNKLIKVSVANDAICLLLSGLLSYPADNLVGAIMGTGTNITFFHRGAAINLESANFDKFVLSDEGKFIDAQSVAPGTSLFEKETSGGYLYKQFNLLLKNHHSAHPPISSSKQLAEIAESNHIPALSDLAQSLIQRSATYLAAQLAAIAEFKQQPITVVMEGSFYWKSELYKRTMSNALTILPSDFPVTIVHVENSPILGGAKLVA